MASLRVVHRQLPLAVAAHDAFAWLTRPGALERLLPPWSGIRVVARRGAIADGGEVELALPGPFARRWVARHEGFVAGREFRDRQVAGPFRSWLHVHRVLPAEDGCLLEDQIEYVLPGGAVGRWLAQGVVERQLARTWRHRDVRIAEDLARHAAWAGRPALRIAVSGATGLIGSELCAFLGGGGHRVQRIARRPEGDDIGWDPGRALDAAALEGVDAVVHLAGRTVAERWTPAVRAEIRASRVDATRHLCAVLAALRRPPRVLVCASGVGWYGERGDHAVKEDAPAGAGFLAEVCRDWEAAAAPARAAGIRVVHARFGMVVSARGGALPKLLTPARLGLAGPVGGGAQWVPWIAIDDAVAALHHLVMADEIAGAVNLVSPEPVTNRELMRSVARAVRRPAVTPLPATMVDLLFGAMGRETLLTSTRALPGRLLGVAFGFRLPRLADALRRELGS